jgi:hypothetical protein
MVIIQNARAIPIIRDIGEERSDIICAVEDPS